MSRPLVITDCDEVLLHMVSHFKNWLDEDQDVTFKMNGGDFANALRRKDNDEPIEQAEIWRLLNLFFDHEMERQTEIPGASAALAKIGENADVVVLTNLLDHRRDQRTQQLATHGINVPVFTNQGPKGLAIRKILDEYKPSQAIFIDDLAQHHASAFEETPEVGRLHFVGEPTLAPHIPCAHVAGHADARIDRWDEALPWLLMRLHN
ncbi:HAD family hydrolase [Altererythrobacter sp. ZODW24]|uniref:HAD family hydrolase n=1 Tax=Altererythrobacter sp. ZODW24 TaxID=2185142 RepID=UPI000DF82D0B|nr:HAD family hydrolase [Altererythrobacter sp. ZODW24]